MSCFAQLNSGLMLRLVEGAANVGEDLAGEGRGSVLHGFPHAPGVEGWRSRLAKGVERRTTGGVKARGAGCRQRNDVRVNAPGAGWRRKNDWGEKKGWCAWRRVSIDWKEKSIFTFRRERD